MVLRTVPVGQAPVSEAGQYLLAAVRKSNWASDPHPMQSITEWKLWWGGEGACITVWLRNLVKKANHISTAEPLAPNLHLSSH